MAKTPRIYGWSYDGSDDAQPDDPIQEGDIPFPKDQVEDPNEFVQENNKQDIKNVQDIKNIQEKLNNALDKINNLEQNVDNKIGALEQEVGILQPQDYQNQISKPGADTNTDGSNDNDFTQDVLPDFITHCDGDTHEAGYVRSRIRSLRHDSVNLIRIWDFDNTNDSHFDCCVVCRWTDDINGITKPVYRRAGGPPVTCDTRPNDTGHWRTGFAFIDHRHHIARADSAGRADSCSRSGYADCSGHSHLSDCTNQLHSTLHDIVEGTDTSDDHKLPNHPYVSCYGNFNRNAMTTGLGDIGGVASVDVTGRALTDDNVINALTWKSDSRHLIDSASNNVLDFNKRTLDYKSWRVTSDTDINWGGDSISGALQVNGGLMAYLGISGGYFVLDGGYPDNIWSYDQFTIHTHNGLSIISASDTGNTPTASIVIGESPGDFRVEANGSVNLNAVGDINLNPSGNIYYGGDCGKTVSGLFTKGGFVGTGFGLISFDVSDGMGGTRTIQAIGKL